ncbi:MAG: hypothetical protein LBM72_00455, partial [Mycoplasmataceae bacterium]|nr:hypothetical protein [Mycoplasmataceae bacterium]
KLKFKSLADLLAIFTNQHNMQPGMRNKNKCFAWFLLIYFGSINLDYVNEGITAEDFVRTWAIKFEDLWATLMRNKWNGGASGSAGRRRFGGGGANYQTRQEFEEDIHIIKWDVNNPKFNIDTVEPKSPVQPSRLR